MQSPLSTRSNIWREISAGRWLKAGSILLLVELLLLASQARAQEPPAPILPAKLSLEQALRIFRAQGLDLLIADAAVQSAEGDLRMAGLVPNPSWTTGLYKAFFQKGPPPLFETDLGWYVGLSDSNAIEDTLSGKRGLRLKVARPALQAAKLARVDAQRNLEFQVKSQYNQALLARDVLDFALEVQKGWNRTFELSRLRYQRGAISEADESKIEVAKLEADQAVAITRQALAAAKTGLAFLLGVRDKVPQFDVEEDLPKYAIPAPLASATRESLLADALVHRPDLKGLQFQRDRSLASIQLAKRLRFPDIAISVQYSAQGSPNGACASGLERDSSGQCFNPITDPRASNPSSPIAPLSPPMLTFGLSGTLPLFYQQQGEIRKAEADFRMQSAQHAKVRAQIVSDVGNAFNNFATTKDLVERMEGRLLDRAKLARDLTRIQYEKGAASLLEYLDAQRTFIAINVEYLTDLANYWTAVFQLEQAVGIELRQ
jgi:cobalt-zinc-cadmium efflux system outer membrane protein